MSPIPGFPGSQSEMIIQTIEAFGSTRPLNLAQVELEVALINAIQAFAGGGGGGIGNVVWRQFPLTYGAYAFGQPFYTSVTGDIILDYIPYISEAYDGWTPQLDVTIGGSTVGLLASQGAAPIPMWVPWTTPGANTGLRVPGAAPGPRASQSYQSGLATVSSSPVMAGINYVEAGGTLSVNISQDGTSTNPALFASVTATSAPTFTLTVNSSNNLFTWSGTDPVTGGSGRAPELFTVPSGAYSSLGSPGSPGTLEWAISTAIGADSGEMFNTLATVSDTGGMLVISNIVAGSTANGNTFGPSKNNDIQADLGFDPIGLLGGGLGGDPQSSQGASILLLLTATPQ